MKREIKNFLSKIILLAVVCVLVDKGAAWILLKYYKKCPSGDVHEINYALSGTKEKILLMGSSRARHHLVSTIFEDSLGITAYNTGMDGQGIFYHFSILAATLERYKPVLVVLDVTERDLIETEDFGLDALGELNPYYGNSQAIDTMLHLRGWSEQIKLTSGLYRFNSKISEIISGYSMDYGIEKGYKPLYPKWKDALTASDFHSYKLDSAKIHCLRRFIALAKSNNVKLVLTVSPVFKIYNQEDILFASLSRIADEYSVPVLNHGQDKYFLSRPYLFKDKTHVNHQGAVEYTRELISEIKPMLAAG